MAGARINVTRTAPRKAPPPKPANIRLLDLMEHTAAHLFTTAALLRQQSRRETENVNRLQSMATEMDKITEWQRKRFRIKPRLKLVARSAPGHEQPNPRAPRTPGLVARTAGSSWRATTS
jgi:hypothetical protein